MNVYNANEDSVRCSGTCVCFQTVVGVGLYRVGVDPSFAVKILFSLRKLKVTVSRSEIFIGT